MKFQHPSHNTNAEKNYCALLSDQPLYQYAMVPIMYKNLIDTLFTNTSISAMAVTVTVYDLQILELPY